MPLTMQEKEARDLRQAQADFATSLIEFCELGPDQWTLQKTPCLDRRRMDQGFAVPYDCRVERGYMIYFEGRRYVVAEIIRWERYQQLQTRYLGAY